jgi:molybdate/tungstate transport system ATP-binding protein
MIRLEQISVELGGFILKDINLTVETGEYFILLGPTGAGKTVLLETIAGLNRTSQGNIRLNDKDITFLEPERRNVSIVYQDYSLFPHLSARDNILFGLRMKKAGDSTCKSTLEWIAELLDVNDLLKRRVNTLSGGERQKVSLARALAIKPALLLLDEPLSALDPQTREQVRDELRQLHRALGMTVIHVTHDFEEAIALGDRIAVLGNGGIQQVGTPEDIYSRPNSEFVAKFMMMRNLFYGEVYVTTSGACRFRAEHLNLGVPQVPTGPYLAGIRPEDITISLPNDTISEDNRLTGNVTVISDRGPLSYVTVQTPAELICLIPWNIRRKLRLIEGTEVFVSFPASAVHLIRKE